MPRPSLPSTVGLALCLLVTLGLYTSLSNVVECPPRDFPGPSRLLGDYSSSSTSETVESVLSDDAITHSAPASSNSSSRQTTSFFTSEPVQVLLPNAARDNDLIGKSCRFDEATRAWDCRDCGTSNRYSQWTDCPSLPRRHMCGDLQGNHDFDRPQPRVYTYMDPLSLETRNVLTHYIDRSNHYEQIPCEPLEECWNMTRCSNIVEEEGGPMKVFVHHSGVNPKKNKAKKYLALAEQRYPDLVQAVEDPNEACMLVMACDAYESVEELQTSPVWNEGRNHFIWEANRCFDTHADRPFDFPKGVHYARASLATSSLTDANVRKHYDIPLARTSSFRVTEEQYDQVLETMGQKRHWLVAFKGNVYNDWPHVWWTHRWLAAEYWDPSDDPEVAVDVTCDIKPNYTDQYDYTNLLMNSTFFFCPGGGATQSFRFTEALGLGAIPVVTPDLLPPFAYDLDWSGCVVRVSPARIVDLPRLLRQISPEEIRQRQARCQDLFQKTVGWVPFKGLWKIDVDRTLFMTSLKIWAWRIRQYHANKKAREELEDGLFVVSKEGSHDYVEWKH